MDTPLSIFSFPRAILHIDGDAFFASCEQARDPALKGKPVVTGKERGIAASMSYEAKARGVTRGMSTLEIRRMVPEAIFLPSDYETYSLLSKRFYSIVRRYTPDVEEYGVDECFADLTGLRRPLRMGYEKIALHIKEELDRELGFTFSAGLAPNKTLAKVASKWKKPSGFTSIPGYRAHEYLLKTPVEKVWGIGSQTTALLHKHGIYDALSFVNQKEEWVRANFSKPFYETWQELRGKFVLPLETSPKETYASIQKVKTFTPPSTDPEFVFSQLAKNIENACIKLRRYRLATERASFFLKMQNFRYAGIEVDLSRPVATPADIVPIARGHFFKIFRRGTLYRSTGVTLLNLLPDSATGQQDFWGSANVVERNLRVFKSVDAIAARFGKHTVHLASSLSANKFSQHLGERGDIPQRKEELFRGETKRQRLGIPMFMGEIK
jgi:DNA polymerase-4/DNA polymerase V